MNGSGKIELVRQSRNARRQLENAIQALYAAAPHGRDYYPQGQGAYEAAREQHDARTALLEKVLGELGRIEDALEDGGSL